MFIIYLLLINLTIKVKGINLYEEQIISGGKTYNSYKFNIVNHLCGISPYFESNNDELNPSPPENCHVDKTVYLIRHGSVYVDDYDYDYIINPFLERLNKSLNKEYYSKLSFLSSWISPITNKNEQIEKLTKSGILESFELGVQLSYRYSKILPNKKDSKFKIWTSSSQRTKQTATAIFAGLFPGRKKNQQIINISENKNRGANSLTPTKTCQIFNSSLGSKEAQIWLTHYTKPIIKRFNSFISNFHFIPNDILAMQQLCGYETVIRGQSPFCHLFTSEEWLAFEYYFDIKYSYELGYDNYLSAYMGMPWIKSMTDIFHKSISKNQNLYINVVHREMLPIVLVSLGLFNQSEYIEGNSIKTKFPLNEINSERIWKTSKIIPFLGRIAFERLDCSSISYNGSFVRIIINSSVKPLSGCSQGPGYTCPLQHFINYVDQRYNKYKKFSKICQNNNTIDHFTFYQKIN